MRADAAPASEDVRGRMGATDCERLRSGPVAQPVNTLTSLGYVAGAGIVLRRVGRGNPDGHRPVMVYSALLALVGVGSVAFHGPQPAGAKASSSSRSAINRHCGVLLNQSRNCRPFSRVTSIVLASLS